MTPYTPRTPMYAHQARALELSGDREAFALLCEMGTGKTKIVIDTIARLAGRGALSHVLVVAPKGVCSNWTERELPVHMPLAPALEWQSYLWRSGGGAVWRKGYGAFRANLDGLALSILVVNVEALSSVREVRMECEMFLKAGPSMLVVDESTCVKSPGAKRTKEVIRLAGLAKYRRILTGSPVTRDPLDLYSQFQVLDWRILGHKSFYSFRNRYAVTRTEYFGSRAVQVVVGFRNLEELSEKISRHSLRILKSECLDLPPKVYERRSVAMSQEQRKLYESLRSNAQAELAGGTFVSATAVIVQLLRLQQVACGWVTDEVGDIHNVPNGRLECLLDILEETEGKVIIWCPWVQGIRDVKMALEERYGAKAVVTMYGGTSDADRADAVRWFQDDPAVRFFIGNPSVAGFGLTLTAASTVVYYANSFNLEHRLQSEDRAHRIGQTKSVTYVDIVTENSVDERVLSALRAKVDIASMINRDGPSKWLE